MLALAEYLPDFHVVVPSLPGFGYSMASASYRCDRDSMAATVHALMRLLGHERYFTYGEDGYARLQTRKPDTLAAGLVDSPAGLAAWLVEKFRSWSDCDGDVERRFTKDALLTTVMQYWSTASIGTSFRSYAEGAESPLPVIEVPASVAVQRHEREYPRAMAERAYADLRSFRHMPSGGHFTAAEEPAAVAGDIRALARSVGAVP